MVTVTILSGNHEPVEPGIPFQLVSAEGTVLGRAQTDGDGVVTFDVSPSSVGQVAIRLYDEAIGGS